MINSEMARPFRSWLMFVMVACVTTPSFGAPVAGTVQRLPGGPVPVALATLSPSQLRTLNHAAGFLVIDARGRVRWGRGFSGPTPYVGTLLDRGDYAFTHIFPLPPMDPSSPPGPPPPPAPRFRPEGEIVEEGDSYGVLSQADTTDVIILADATAPAWITLCRGIQAFGSYKVALAAGAANTATLYQFGEPPWKPWSTRADLTVRVDDLDALAGKHPKSVLLELTDDTKTSELVAALGALSQTGVERVRLHRMMGWGAIGPSEIVSVQGPSAEDDEITEGEPAKVEVDMPRVEGQLSAYGVDSALVGYAPRFRYCFEKRGTRARRGRIELVFDVAADGEISNAKATGFDAKIASCVAGAVFDLDITPYAVHGAGRVSATISFTRTPAPHAPEREVRARVHAPNGFWCFEAGDVGLCAREEAQCQAARDGYNGTNTSLGAPADAMPCKAQRTAWTSDGEHFLPTRKQCGASCKQAR